MTANSEVRRWLAEVANQRIHGTTQERPAQRLHQEDLQGLPAPWRGDIRAARPQGDGAPAPLARPVTVIAQLEQATPPQHPLTVYERLLEQIRDELAVSV